MKKLASLIISGAILTSLASCSSSSSNSSKAPTEPVTNAQGRTIVTMGMPGYHQLIAEKINRYNASQRDYKVEIVDYTKKTGRTADECMNDDFKEEFNMMKRDILAGDAPDMIALDRMYMFPYVRTGMFVDMYELMDSGVGMSREDFLPNVLEGFEVDGEIPSIGTNFRVETVIAKTKFVGEDAENWTMEQFLEKAENLPEDMSVIPAYTQNSRQTIFDIASRMIVRECMDIVDLKSDFSNDSLKKAFEFALEFPDASMVEPNWESMSDVDRQLIWNEYTNCMPDDKSLMMSIQLSNFAQSDGNDIWWAFGDDDLTFVGYPSDNGCGAIAYCDYLYGITKGAGDPETAWAVLSDMMTNEQLQSEMSNEGSGIPVAKEALDRLYNNKDASDYHTIYYSYLGDNEETGKKITQERVDQLYNYVQTVKFTPYRDYELDSIVKEEADYVLGGERSAEECIRILNDRIGTYMAENE